MGFVREDKAKVCELLLTTLQETRHMDDLVCLDYSGILAGGEEFVTATFTNGSRKTINVTYDSGWKLIKDVMKGLG